MKIQLNGKEYDVKTACTVTELLSEVSVQPENVAVEVNTDIIPRERYADTTITPGATVEIIHFVGGG